MHVIICLACHQYRLQSYIEAFTELITSAYLARNLLLSKSDVSVRQHFNAMIKTF